MEDAICHIFFVPSCLLLKMVTILAWKLVCRAEKDATTDFKKEAAICSSGGGRGEGIADYLGVFEKVV